MKNRMKKKNHGESDTCKKGNWDRNDHIESRGK